MSLPTRLFISSSFSAFFAVLGHDKLTVLVSNESTSTFELLQVYLPASPPNTSSMPSRTRTSC
jgi:hypothetical protein